MGLVRECVKSMVRWRWRKVVPPYVALFDPSRSREATFRWPPGKPAQGETRFVIVSPHLDDAPLSLGGRMLQWGGQCLVVDLFSTVSWWRFQIESHEDPRIQRARDAEEDLIAELTGAKVRRVGLMEAPRRGYRLTEIFSAEILPAEAAGETIQATVDALRTEGRFEWFLPLGVGNHVDHRIARNAALAALLDGGIEPERIRFYEDLPYAAQTPGVHDFTFFVLGKRLVLADETPIDFKRKTTLLKTYYSQLTASQIWAVGDYARRFGSTPIERTWKLA